MKKCKVTELPGLDLTKYSFMMREGKNLDLLKQIFTDHSQLLKEYNIKLNIKIERVSDTAPCGDCGGALFLRTGTCHVCVTCGASQGCS